MKVLLSQFTKNSIFLVIFIAILGILPTAANAQTEAECTETFKEFIDNRTRNPGKAHTIAQGFLQRCSSRDATATEFLKKWVASYKKTARISKASITSKRESFSPSCSPAGWKTVIAELGAPESQIIYLESGVRLSLVNAENKLDPTGGFVQIENYGDQAIEWRFSSQTGADKNTLDSGGIDTFEISSTTENGVQTQESIEFRYRCNAAVIKDFEAEELQVAEQYVNNKSSSKRSNPNPATARSRSANRSARNQQTASSSGKRFTNCTVKDEEFVFSRINPENPDDLTDRPDLQQTGWTPLMQYAAVGFVCGVEVTIKLGADINHSAPDEEGTAKTPIELVKESIEILEAAKNLSVFEKQLLVSFRSVLKLLQAAGAE